MALKYANVSFVDASKIAEIAKTWLSTAGDFSSAEKSYAANVHKAVKDGSWEGITAVAAESVYGTTRKHLSGAQAEARAVGKILQEGARKIRSLQKDLQDKESQIRRDDLHVSADGVVWSSNPAVSGAEESKDLNAAEQREKEQVVSSIKSAIEKRQRELDAIVAQFDGIDTAMSLALHKAMSLSNESESLYNPQFNDKATEDLEAIRANRAEELTVKVNGPEGLTAAERRELRIILNESAKDKSLAKEILDRIGADEFIKLAASIEHERMEGNKEEKNDLNNIEKNLAKTLARASQNEEFSPKEWLDEFSKYGKKDYEWPTPGAEDGIEVKGYQLLLTTMEKGSGYSKELIEGLGDNIIAAEEKDEDIWKADSTMNRGANVIPDPLDTVLKVMSQNPSLATEFLNDESKLRHIDKERNWDLVEEYQTRNDTRGERVSGKLVHVDAENSREGFAAALEAALTGRSPGSSMPADLDSVPNHKGSRSELFSTVVEYYGNKVNGASSGNEWDLSTEKSNEAIHPNLRKALGAAVSDYPADVREILGHSAKTTTTENEVTMDVHDLRGVIRGISDDPNVFRDVQNSQLVENARVLEGYDKEAFIVKDDDLAEQLHWSGSALGALDAIRADVVETEGDDRISEIEYNKMISYHGAGAPITAIPYLGDLAQRALDQGLTEAANAVIEKETQNTDKEISEVYVGGREKSEAILLQYCIELGFLEEHEANKRIHEPVSTFMQKLKVGYGTGANEVEREINAGGD